MYTETDYQNAAKQVRTRLIAWLALAAAFLAGMIVFIALRQEYVSMAVAGVGFAACFFLWSFKVSPWVRYNRFLREMKNGQRRQLECEFVSMEPETRFHDGVEVREMLVTVGKEEEDERLFYWDIDKTYPSLKPGARIRVESFGNFVVSLTCV